MEKIQLAAILRFSLNQDWIFFSAPFNFPSVIDQTLHMWHTTNGTLYPSKTPGSGCNYYTTTYRFLFKTGHVGDRGPDGELASLISCRTDPNFTKTFSGNFTSAVFNRLSFHTALIKLKRPIVSSDESGSITFCSGCNHSSPS